LENQEKLNMINIALYLFFWPVIAIADFFFGVELFEELTEEVRNFLFEKKPISPSPPQLNSHEYTLGDPTCINNARSPYLQCAVNPSGVCGSCKHWETAEHNKILINRR
jgi:Family of unknown function (DUF6464)